MKTVWKHSIALSALDLNDTIQIAMQEGAEVLHVGTGGDSKSVTFWVLLDPEAPLEFRRFRIAGTGHSVPDGVRYLGTNVSSLGFVWHLFEVTE